MKEQIKSPTISVIDVAWFLGSHLTRALCTVGHNIIVLYRNNSTFETISNFHHPNQSHTFETIRYFKKWRNLK